MDLREGFQAGGGLKPTCRVAETHGYCCDADVQNASIWQLKSEPRTPRLRLKMAVYCTRYARNGPMPWASTTLSFVTAQWCMCLGKKM